MKNKNKRIKELEGNLFWTRWFMIIMFIILLFVFFRIVSESDDLKQQLQSCQEDELLYHTYYLVKNDSVTIHTTTYFPYNNSYTISRPFTCDEIVYFGEFESYLRNCKSPYLIK